MAKTKTTEKWKTRLDPDRVFHFMDNDTVIRDDKKVLSVTMGGKQTFNFSGIGRRATAAEFKKANDNMAGWEKL